MILKHLLNYEFVYIFLFSSLILLFLAIVIKQQIVRKVLLMFFSFFVVLFIFEFVFSLSFPKYSKEISYDYKTTNINHSKETNKLIDIRYFDKETKRFVYINNDFKRDIYDKDKDRFYFIFSKEYSVYKNTKFRYTKCNEQSKEAYVFLGCSFVFGDGVNDEETLPYYFSKKMDFKYNVFNYGVSGKGSNTALNILNTGLNKDIKYKHFFFSLISDLIKRNFRLQSTTSDRFLFLDDKVKVMKTRYDKYNKLFIRMYIYRKVFVPIIDNILEQYYENYMIKSLEEMNNIIQEKYNSKFTVIIWDYESWNPQRKYSKYFIKRLKETNLDLIFIPEKFCSVEAEGKYRIEYDMHPTAKANEEIAQILYEHINKDNK